MRCVSCGAILRSHEATRRMVNTGDYADMCDRCFSTISDDVAATDGHYDTTEFDTEIDNNEGEGFGTGSRESEEAEWE